MNSAFKKGVRSFSFIAIILLIVWDAGAFDLISVTWEPNDPAPQGYRVYRCTKGQSYDFSSPLWEGAGTSAIVAAPPVGETHCFVVRAFDGDLEGLGSDEVCCLNISGPKIKGIRGK